MKSDQEEIIEEGWRGLSVRPEMKTRVKKKLLRKEAENCWLRWRKKTSTVSSLRWPEKVVWNRGKSCEEEEEGAAYMMVLMNGING